MDGVLVIDKPSGWTSHDVVAKIRNITRIKKVGHTGTLDPFATGVLPLTTGKATRLTSYFLNSDKVYRGVIRFGFATSTFDVDGEPAGEDSCPRLDAERLRSIMSRYVGHVIQTIPPYSARKVQGKPMYAYAREGVPLDPATKEVHIKSLSLLHAEGCEAEFELECAAGTYARSLAHDLGNDYGCGAHLIRLRRTRCGEYAVDAACPMGEGDRFFERDFFLDRIIPMSRLLNDIPAIVISGGDRAKVLHGMDLNLLTSAPDAAEYRLLDEHEGLVAVARRLQTFASPAGQPVSWVRVHPFITFS